MIGLEDMNKNKIFEKIKIKDTEFSNRIVVSPMCQYSAKDGLMNDWHFQHLSQFGFSGAGSVSYTHLRAHET